MEAVCHCSFTLLKCWQYVSITQRALGQVGGLCFSVHKKATAENENQNMWIKIKLFFFFLHPAGFSKMQISHSFFPVVTVR